MNAIKEKTNNKGRIIMSKFRLKNAILVPSAVANCFITKQEIKVSAPPSPRAASKPGTAAMLTIVLTVVVTVEIIFFLT